MNQRGKELWMNYSVKYDFVCANHLCLNHNALAVLSLARPLLYALYGYISEISTGNIQQLERRAYMLLVSTLITLEHDALALSGHDVNTQIETGSANAS